MILIVLALESNYYSCNQNGQTYLAAAGSFGMKFAGLLGGSLSFSSKEEASNSSYQSEGRASFLYSIIRYMTGKVTI